MKPQRGDDIHVVHTVHSVTNGGIIIDDRGESIRPDRIVAVFPRPLTVGDKVQVGEILAIDNGCAWVKRGAAYSTWPLDALWRA